MLNILVQHWTKRIRAISTRLYKRHSPDLCPDYQCFLGPGSVFGTPSYLDAGYCECCLWKVVCRLCLLTYARSMQVLHLHRAYIRDGQATSEKQGDHLEKNSQHDTRNAGRSSASLADSSADTDELSIADTNADEH